MLWSLLFYKDITNMEKICSICSGTVDQLALTVRQVAWTASPHRVRYKQVYRYRRVAKNILLYSLYWDSNPSKFYITDSGLLWNWLLLKVILVCLFIRRDKVTTISLLPSNCCSFVWLSQSVSAWFATSKGAKIKIRSTRLPHSV